MKHHHTTSYSIARGQRPRGLPAFTLIEMVVSLSVISIVFLAMGSVMMLATKAISDPDAPTHLMLDATEILDQMASELQVATSVIVATDKELAFTVPDRDSDGLDETIVYQWGGAAGDPLVRQYKGGSRVQILPGVGEFNLTYDVKIVPQPDLLVESAEVLLSSKTSAASQGDFQIKDSEWAGQYFEPAGLPVEVVAWSVTRVLFVAAPSGDNTGQTLVQLRSATGTGLPTDTVLEQKTMYESDLSPFNLTWQTFNFSNVRDLALGEGLCLVLKFSKNSPSAYVLYDNASGANFLVSSDEGKNWSLDSGKEMAHVIFGTYTTPVPQPPIYLLRSVTLALNPGKDSASRVRTSVVALNQPQMP